MSTRGNKPRTRTRHDHHTRQTTGLPAGQRTGHPKDFSIRTEIAREDTASAATADQDTHAAQTPSADPRRRLQEETRRYIAIEVDSCLQIQSSVIIQANELHYQILQVHFIGHGVQNGRAYIRLNIRTIVSKQPFLHLSKPNITSIPCKTVDVHSQNIFILVSHLKIGEVHLATIIKKSRWTGEIPNRLLYYLKMAKKPV
jgi:hypothetical protein